jgi:hypothetical protein
MMMQGVFREAMLSAWWLFFLTGHGPVRAYRPSWRKLEGQNFPFWPIRQVSQAVLFFEALPRSHSMMMPGVFRPGRIYLVFVAR